MYLYNILPAAVPMALALASVASAAVNVTTCNGKKYVYEELAGYGYLPSNGRDKTGDTLGGIGSSIAMDKNSWKKEGKSYKGLVYALPDRGWNTQGRRRDTNYPHNK